jgi:predicted phosphodiesterase
MNLVVLSDTHYGHDSRTHKIHEKFLKELGDTCLASNVSLIVHCGDWISSNQHQLPRTWKMFRSFLGNIPIVTVRGNHDLWNYDYWGVHEKKRRWAKFPANLKYSEILIQHEKWAEEFDIKILSNKPFIYQNVVFYGFDGWYWNVPPPTNDFKYMDKIFDGKNLSEYLRNKANKDLDNILIDIETNDVNFKYTKKVCVTHMPPYFKDEHGYLYCADTNYLNFITEKFNYLFVGHNHQVEDWVNTYLNHTCRIINGGTKFNKITYGYNCPNYKLVEI